MFSVRDLSVKSIPNALMSAALLVLVVAAFGWSFLANAADVLAGLLDSGTTPRRSP